MPRSLSLLDEEHPSPTETMHDIEVDAERGPGYYEHSPTREKSSWAPSPTPPHGRSTFKSIMLIATCTAALVVHLYNTASVSVALPILGKDLGIPEAKLQWLISAYSLSSGCLLLFFGRIADLFGRKLVFMSGTLCLMAFSLGLGFGQNEITLDILRGLQGVGAAATIPSALGILAHSFPPSKMRSIAFATFAAGAPVGAAFGMVLGGILTQFTQQTWRATFYFATGLNAACLIAGYFSIDPDTPSTESDRRIDWIGALLVTAGLVLIVFVLSDGEIVGWNTGYIIALLIVGVLLMGLFIAWQRYLESILDSPSANPSRWTPPPLMRLSIWGRAKGRFAVMMAIAFLNWSAFLSWSFWVQLYYQDFQGLSPILTVVRLLPMFVTGVLCNVAIAMTIGRVSVIWIIIMGTTLTGTASLLFAVINPSSPYWAFGFPAAIVGVFGADFVFASGTLFVAKVALPHEQSVGGALFQTMTQIGTAFGLTITTIVFDKVVARESGPASSSSSGSGISAPRSAQLQGYKSAQWTAFAFAMFASLLGALFLRGVGIVGHSKADEARDKEQADALQGKGEA